MNKTGNNKKIFNVRNILMEMIGSMAITYIGCWAKIQEDMSRIHWSGMSLAISLTILVFTYFGYKISGAYFNPAITLGVLILRQIKITTGVFYIMA